MKSAPPAHARPAVDPAARHAARAAHPRRHAAGFTLAEVLAALVFLAIVIPVAIEGLRIAGTAGQVGLRKPAAARIAERVLNEWIATSAVGTGTSSGIVEEGPIQYRWTLRSQLWAEDAMRLVSVQVAYNVQGREHDFRLATLTDLSSN